MEFVCFVLCLHSLEGIHREVLWVDVCSCINAPASMAFLTHSLSFGVKGLMFPLHSLLSIYLILFSVKYCYYIILFIIYQPI
jgi:hypothetical protein